MPTVLTRSRGTDGRPGRGKGHGQPDELAPYSVHRLGIDPDGDRPKAGFSLTLSRRWSVRTSGKEHFAGNQFRHEILGRRFATDRAGYRPRMRSIVALLAIGAAATAALAFTRKRPQHPAAVHAPVRAAPSVMIVPERRRVAPPLARFPAPPGAPCAGGRGRGSRCWWLRLAHRTAGRGGLAGGGHRARAGAPACLADDRARVRPPLQVARPSGRRRRTQPRDNQTHDRRSPRARTFGCDRLRRNRRRRPFPMLKPWR